MDNPLPAVTIIPPKYYVQRSADRQLRKIIDEMGRPAYVLVARQMGKTNLLLSLKRECESSQDFYVYFDLSSPFQDAREFFRNIIDVILDLYKGSLQESLTEVLEQRKLAVAPHKEHEQELRILLRSIPGKLVIILDEIDALTNAHFSDQVFAQIRSVYFSRINYPDFNRLTYVLSGVADPGQLIRDKRISPFNIGAKIYLDDFTKEEFSDFLRKAQISLNPEASERIYHWARGNPRVTWDICSHLQDGQREIMAQGVDDVVKKLYLTDFSRPPVDHIRRIAEIDREIRTALLDLTAGRGASISDETKGKLYLAGVIGSDFSSESLRVKNPIIEIALSPQWLADIEKKEKGLIRIATEKHALGHYADSLRCYEEYLHEREAFPEDQAALCYYIMGHCCYRIQKYSDAVDLFARCTPANAGESSIRDSRDYYNGICLFYLARFDECIKVLSEFIERKPAIEYVYQARLNLASAYATSTEPDKIETSVAMNRSLIEDLKSSIGVIQEDHVRKILPMSHCNLGAIYLRLGKSEDARGEYISGIEAAAVEAKPNLISRYVPLETDQDKIRYWLRNSLDLITSNKLNLTKDSGPEYQLGFNVDTVNRLLLSCYQWGLADEFDSLISYLESTPGHDYQTKPIHKLYCYLAVEAMRDQRHLLASKILREVIRKNSPESYVDNVIYECFKYLCVIEQKLEAEFSFLGKEYIAHIIGNSKSYDVHDLRIVTYLIGAVIKEREWDSASKFIESGIAMCKAMGDPWRYNELLMGYFSMLVATGKGDHEAASVIAGKITREFERSSVMEFSQNDEAIFSERELQFIVEKARAKVRFVKPFITPPPQQKKIGRNEIVAVQFSDGSVSKGKYKKYIHLLESGTCRLIIE